MVKLATKTLLAISNAIEKDQGKKYRGYLKKLLPKAEDVYSQKEEPFRSHLGASLIGRECSRELWYNFHWVKAKDFSARILRLFNRGHLEEPRMMAALLNIGCEIYQYDDKGNQFRIEGVDGHFGSALDGVVIGIPDLSFGEPGLVEFKTHNDSSFQKLVKDGMQKTKPEHNVQMQIYMDKYNLKNGLYLATNKDNDDLYGEIIAADKKVSDKYVERAHFIIYSQNPPAKISDNSAFFGCRFCDYKPVCHGKDAADTNCRTCQFSQPTPEGWKCNLYEKVLDKEKQLKGCPSYIVHPLIKAPL